METKELYDKARKIAHNSVYELTSTLTDSQEKTDLTAKIVSLAILFSNNGKN